MSRRTRRSPRFPWTTRQQALGLLLAWCASLLLPAFHFDPDDKLVSGHGAAAVSGSHCSGNFRPLAATSSVHGACPNGSGCEDPWHHHHSDASHDATQCPICSSLLERIVDAPVVFDSTPARVEFVAPHTPRLAAPSERLKVSLARGPPPSPRSC